MSNDNPEKDDVKRAEVDSARRHMEAKTDDEREFYARKNKAVKSFQKFVKESVHPKVRSALNAAPPELALHSAKGAYRRLKAQKVDSGIQSGKSPKGSSRAILNTKEHDVVLDGKPTKVASILKIAHRGNRELWDGKLLGQHQNKAESSPKTQKHATMIRQKDGTWKTNPHGVLPPVLKQGSDDKYFHMAHAGDAHEEDFRELSRSKSHPHGMTMNNFMDAVEYNDKHSNHVVQKFINFKKDTGITDFHQDNFGVWIHPHTGEGHLVLRDAGFDSEVNDGYMDAGFRRLAKRISRWKTNEYGNLVKKTPLSGKKKQAKKFKTFVKEDWKRAAMMGAAATAAGAGTAAAIGFPVVAGAVIAGGHYALSKSGLRKDLKFRRKK